MMETHSVIESFTDLQDAILFFDTTLYEYSSLGWNAMEGSGITYVNYQWRVGLIFDKKR